MRGAIFFSLIFFIFVISMLVLYWFVPVNTTEFIRRGNSLRSDNYNFTLENVSLESMQFYSNMRFPDSRISYEIEDCPLKKTEDMMNAFGIIESKTVLEFYPSGDPEISITCDSKNKIEEGLFIAGEGGPTNITKGGEFSVIFYGKVLLIKESRCERPNVALHELLHVLGFDHSGNPNNIMYPISECGQTIGQDQIKVINDLYSIPSYPDLVFENVSAVMHGKYLDLNISVRNGGLADSRDTKISVYADNKLIKEIDLESLEVGRGVIIFLQNVLVLKFGIEELEFVIDADFQELDKENNRIMLEVLG